MFGLYVHIPFCKKKCFYCDFFSVEYSEYISSQYIEAVSKQSVQYKGSRIDTIYIGGGTPSVLTDQQIEKLLDSLRYNFNTGGLKEFTFELNPESVTKDKLKILKSYGVDRLSMGLQSVDNGLLKKIGRVHDLEMFVRAYDTSRKEGFTNFNLDLIYGLPGQSLADWEKNLQVVFDLGCEHVSLYPLSIEEGTLFYSSGVNIDDNLQREMYETAVNFFSGKGFNHYEISNWSKRGKESLHNSNYWRNFEYIGLGAGASGYENRFRYSNTENIEKYIDLAAKNLSVKEENDFIDEASYEAEAIMLGLRLLDEGVDIKTFKNHSSLAVLERLLQEKMLKNDSGKIKLPENAVFTSNHIMSQFMK